MLPLKRVKIGSRLGGDKKILDTAVVCDSPESHCIQQTYGISVVLKLNGGWGGEEVTGKQMI